MDTSTTARPSERHLRRDSNSAIYLRVFSRITITLIGQPQQLRREGGIVTFKISTGPASSTAPKGLSLFKAATCVVFCSERQYNRGRADEQDQSELILEGYLEPRMDEQGKPDVAVMRSPAANSASRICVALAKCATSRQDR